MVSEVSNKISPISKTQNFFPVNANAEYYPYKSFFNYALSMTRPGLASWPQSQGIYPDTPKEFSNFTYRKGPKGSHFNAGYQKRQELFKDGDQKKWLNKPVTLIGILHTDFAGCQNPLPWGIQIQVSNKKNCIGL